jgi:predicted AAA+ superfamily ATPase
LILPGARQVGKTTIVEMFSQTYTRFINLNLELQEDGDPFKAFRNIHQLVKQLFFLRDQDIAKVDETLLFIDEIQEVPQAINILRYFYEQAPELHVIAAGSLLEAALGGDAKILVGRVEYKIVHPGSVHVICWTRTFLAKLHLRHKKQHLLLLFLAS